MRFENYMILLFIMLISFDVSVFLNINFIRPIIGIIYLGIIPGALLLFILGIHECGFLNKILFSIGLSISFLIICGFLINNCALWLGYDVILSTNSLLFSFNLLIVLMLIISFYKLKAKNYKIKLINKKLNILSIILIVISTILPAISLIARRHADAGGNSKPILFIFLFILLLLCIITIYRCQISNIVYPFILFLTSLSILSMRSMISSYLIGGDIYSEFHIFSLVSLYKNWSVDIINSHWAPTNLLPSLSVSLLPQILHSLLGIDPLFIFKFVLIIPLALVPVAGYSIYRNYFSPFTAFFASIFFIAQVPFIYLLSGQTRIAIALFTFTLILIVLFDKKIKNINKEMLLIIFIISLVFEYYVLPILLLIILLILYIISKFSKETNGISKYTIVMFTLILIFIWWGQIPKAGIYTYLFMTRDVINNLGQIFLEEMYSPTVLNLVNLDTDRNSWLLSIPRYYMKLTVGIMSLGVISASLVVILRKKDPDIKLPTGYISIMLMCYSFILALMVIPLLSFKYGVDRLYIQLLVILAPAFILGYNLIFASANRISKSRLLDYRDTALALIVIIQLISSSSIVDEIIGIPSSEILNKDSLRYDTLIVYDGEVKAAEWIGLHNENSTVYLGHIFQPGSSDVFEFTRYGIDRKFNIMWLDNNTKIEEGFIFLKNLNIKRNIVHVPLFKGDFRGMLDANLSDYEFQFENEKKVFNSGKANIYAC